MQHTWSRGFVSLALGSIVGIVACAAPDRPDREEGANAPSNAGSVTAHSETANATTAEAPRTSPATTTDTPRGEGAVEALSAAELAAAEAVRATRDDVPSTAPALGSDAPSTARSPGSDAPSTASAPGSNAPSTAPAPRARAEAARILNEALSLRGAEPAIDLERLRTAARAARDVLGSASRNVARLSAAVDVPTSELERDGTRAVARVRRDLQRLALDFVFEPKLEAPRPVGFPDATPVGEIAVLDYPSYRMARVEMDARGDTSAFWKLFRHIESNEIAMTAPVEVAYRRDGTREDSASMAFLYADQDIGRVGDAGDVTVLDVPAATVVSTGLRGSYGESRLAAAREELRAWLREHPEYVEIGPARSMGWNSPMVSDARRFTEVQIVVRRAVGATPGRS